MAQEQQALRVVDNPTAEQLLPYADETQVHWSSPRVQTSGKCYDDHEQEHDDEHHHKKTIMEKVRHKAKKWRQTLTKKKHGRNEDCSTPTSTCSADENNEAEEPDPEYLGTPMYESETAPDAYKDHSSKTPNLKDRRNSATPADAPRVLHAHDADKKLVLDHLNSSKETSRNSTAAATADEAVNNRTLAKTVTEMLSPAYNMVSDATQMIASKIQSPTGRDETGAKMMWDKSVSGSVYVKEYLRNKLEPGEEDRALSEVITEAMSPRKAGPRHSDETSVVEKVRRALSTLLGKEEMMGAASQAQVAARPPLDPKPLQAPARAYQDSSPVPVPVPVPVPLATYLGVGSSPIPAVSTNSYAEVEELGARKLQACAN